MSVSVEENIALWREKIGNASAKWGGAEICAVTKTVDAATINRAAKCGIRTIGENRVQELMSKIDELDPSFDVHLIGSLQTNKVKPLIGRVKVIQSLDRPELAREISRRAAAAGETMAALIQVNIAREPQKGGVTEEELLPFVRACAKLPGLQARGLMAIMPKDAPRDTLEALFQRMRALLDQCAAEAVADTEMTELSMGMSQDYDLAARAGATMVRVGSAIFR